jgi:predicted enzyme related to lactoylglutathione lyase
MVNFRVDDLDALLFTLAANGVEIVPERSEDPAGRFAWVIDCEGNRVELWEPTGTKQSANS